MESAVAQRRCTSLGISLIHAALPAIVRPKGHKKTSETTFGYNPMVKIDASNKAAGYSWATDGLFLGYKAKRPLEVGVYLAG